MNAWESLPAEFNAATWFVDRNVDEGRAKAPAFVYEDRVLSYGDVQHWQRIVIAIKETMRLTKEIDALIPGWPLR